MKSLGSCRYVVTISAAAALLSACGGAPVGAPGAMARLSASGERGSGYIKHVVLVIQENRSFDNFFATFPGADGTRYGCMEPTSGSVRVARRASGSEYCPRGDTVVPLARRTLLEQCDFGHFYRGFLADYDNGRMDGFGGESNAKCPGNAGREVYQYVDPKQIAPYWDIAREYVLADRMFQTQGSGSFTAHQDLIRGGTCFKNCTPPYTGAVSLDDYPSLLPWGCDAKKDDRTSILTWTGSKIKGGYHRGPFPCMTYETLADLFEAQSPQISWKYYTAPEPAGTGKYWNAFDAIEDIRDVPSQWHTHIDQHPNTGFFRDISTGVLPAMSWVTPDAENSDHPGNKSDTGPSWIAQIVNAVGESPYWDSTAIVVVWDDWGGFYDHVPPPKFDDFGGLGFRVPMLIVSPYARETSSRQPGYISNTQYEFASILLFIEGVFSLPTAGTPQEARANSIVNCFDFKQSPRSFSAIPSKYSKSYFLNQKPSNQPVDTE